MNELMRREKAVIPERVVGKKRKEKETEIMNESMKREKRGNTWKSSR